VSDLANMLRAVIANPGDDLPRLHYADICEAGGDYDRAEFIRCQIEIERLYPESKSATVCHRREALRRRERELLDAPWPPVDGRTQESRWVVETGSWWHDAEGWTFSRGFVETITTTLADWLAHGPAIVRAAPVASVTLSDRRPREYRPGYYLMWWEGPATMEGIESDSPHGQSPWLPPGLFRHLVRGIENHNQNGQRERRYFSEVGGGHEAAAIADLSAACLSWAKAEADRREREAEDDEFMTCPVCSGAGQRQYYMRDADHQIDDCNECGGHGQVRRRAAIPSPPDDPQRAVMPRFG
jgi:uncharacterized protein (TIGR02996 family)